MPVGLSWRDGQPRLRWLRLGTVRYTEPFFQQSIDRRLAAFAGGAEQRDTGIEVLLEAHAAAPAPPPVGFVFHMSRCGSTLVAQLLSGLPGATVLAEPPPLDDVLAARLDEAQRLAWLRAMVGVLGRSGGGGPLLVKFDAWHACALPLIRRAFPTVPWVFVCREPLQVLRSHHLRPGRHMVPGVLDPRALGWAAPPHHSLREYGVAALARICTAAADALGSGGGCVIDYRELPDVVWTRLAPAFGLRLDPAQVQGMRQAAAFDAKQRGLPFDPARREAAAADPALAALVAPALAPAYARLLAARGLP